MTEEHHDEAPDFYGDTGIASAHGKVPNWLKLTYFTLPIWGVISFFLFWNGSWGWLDRGYWAQLQRAANTTFPYVNEDDPTLKPTHFYGIPPQIAETETNRNHK